MTRHELPVFICDIPNCAREHVGTSGSVRESWRVAREQGWQHAIVRPMMGGITVEAHQYSGEVCPMHAPGKTGLILTDQEIEKMGAERAKASRTQKKAVRRRNVASKSQQLPLAGM